jgi:hypothetical protein
VADEFFYRFNHVIYLEEVLKNENEQKFFFIFLDTKPILSIIFHMWQLASEKLLLFFSGKFDQDT